MIVAGDDDSRIIIKAHLAGFLLDWNDINSKYGIPIGTFRLFA